MGIYFVRHDYTNFTRLTDVCHCLYLRTPIEKKPTRMKAKFLFSELIFFFLYQFKAEISLLSLRTYCIV